MLTKDLVHDWFKKWETGDFLNLPISEDFRHISPYGTIEGKQVYLDIVAANKDKFLNHRFEIHEELYAKEKACVRYTAIQDKFRLEVTEWYRIKDQLIQEIQAYYNIEEKRIDLQS